MASGGGGGVRRRRRRAGLPGLCWKTCYFPLLVWVVSVCGEERTLIVEVGGVTSVCVCVFLPLQLRALFAMFSGAPRSAATRVCVCVRARSPITSAGGAALPPRRSFVSATRGRRALFDASCQCVRCGLKRGAECSCAVLFPVSGEGARRLLCAPAGSVLCLSPDPA